MMQCSCTGVAAMAHSLRCCVASSYKLLQSQSPELLVPLLLQPDDMHSVHTQYIMLHTTSNTTALPICCTPHLCSLASIAVLATCLTQFEATGRRSLGLPGSSPSLAMYLQVSCHTSDQPRFMSQFITRERGVAVRVE